MQICRKIWQYGSYFTQFRGLAGKSLALKIAQFDTIKVQTIKILEELNTERTFHRFKLCKLETICGKID